MGVKFQIEDIDRGFSRLATVLRGSAGAEAVAGFIAGKGGDRFRGKITFAEIGAILDLGTKPGTTPKIPSRPFMRRAFDANERKYLRMLDEGATAVIELKSTPRAVLTQVANEMRNDILRSMKGAFGAFEANALSTIAAKGSSRPLKNFGLLGAAVKFEVRKL